MAVVVAGTTITSASAATKARSPRRLIGLKRVKFDLEREEAD